MWIVPTGPAAPAGPVGPVAPAGPRTPAGPFVARSAVRSLVTRRAGDRAGVALQARRARLRRWVPAAPWLPCGSGCSPLPGRAGGAVGAGGAARPDDGPREGGLAGVAHVAAVGVDDVQPAVAALVVSTQPVIVPSWWTGPTRLPRR